LLPAIVFRKEMTKLDVQHFKRQIVSLAANGRQLGKYFKIN